MPVIDVAKVSKCFYLQPDRPRSFQEVVLNALHRDRRPAAKEVLWALRDVTFQVQAGETLGLIGSNGSGKSTCLKLLSRILVPTVGTVDVDGRVSAMLELGAGFHPELTGRENIYLHGSVLGLGRRELAQRMDEIIAFAELERFIDVPVKFYSSGMYVRLAFAAAINVEPEILLIDEVLSVGDQHFQEKCLNRIAEIQAQGVTTVFVSHDLETVVDLCDEVIWLDQGVLREEGEAATVVESYLREVHGPTVAPASAASAPAPEAVPPTEPGLPVSTLDTAGTEGAAEAGDASASPGPVIEAAPSTSAPVETPPPDAGESTAEGQVDVPNQETAPPGPPRRWGSGLAEVVGVDLLNGHGGPGTLKTDEPMTVVIRYRAHEPIEYPVFGVAIHREDGVHVTGCNTRLSEFTVPEICGTGAVRYHVERLPLLEGEYRLSVAIHSADETTFYDYQEQWHPFQVSSGTAKPHQGLIHLAAHWEHASDPAADGGEGVR